MNYHEMKLRGTLVVWLTFFSTPFIFIIGLFLGIFIDKNFDLGLSILPFLSTLGTWLGAFATCSAVVVSLWLAFKQLNQDKEILDSTIKMVLSPGYQDEPVIGVSIVSKGNKPTNIQSLSWHGKNAKTAMWVKDYHPLSESLPHILSYGQKINLMHIPSFEKHLARYVCEHMAGKFDELYLLISTTTDCVKIKVDKGLLSIIKQSETK